MDSATQRTITGGSDQESASRMTEATATNEQGWHTDRVGIRRADNGGFIVDCSRSKPGKGDGGGGAMVTGSGSNYEQKDYAFSTIDQVQDFLVTEFGGGSSAEAAGEASADTETVEGEY